MARYHKPMLAIAALAAAAGVVFSFTGRTPTNSAQEQNAVDALPTAPGEPLSTSRLVDLEEGVSVDISVSFLAGIVSADGRALRPAAIHAVFLAGGTYVGASGFHDLIPVESTEPIDLSSMALDVSTPGLTRGENLRSYTITAVPALGLSWGMVTDFQKDVIVQANPH
jgi:hypothetical protein